MDLLIKNARVIDVTQDFIGDIYVKNGLIAEIAKEITKDNAGFYQHLTQPNIYSY